MGNIPSNQQVVVNKTEQQLEQEALNNYNQRIKNYCYPRHGHYYDYQQWCLAQYHLECLPPSCRQGPNYKPQYDSWGNQYY
jgi:hypothetical protein